MRKKKIPPNLLSAYYVQVLYMHWTHLTLTTTLGSRLSHLPPFSEEEGVAQGIWPTAKVTQLSATAGAQTQLVVCT